MYILLLLSFPHLLLNVPKSTFNIVSFFSNWSLFLYFSLLFCIFRLCSPTFFFPPLSPYSLTQVVSQRFPQNSIGAVGSAMFLRFINPAIVSPYETGILDKKPLPRIERGLKLMSKVSLLDMRAAMKVTRKKWLHP